MSTCMKALCRHVKQNKSQEGGRGEVFVGTRGVCWCKDPMIVRTFNLEDLTECLLVETINFGDLCWRVNLSSEPCRRMAWTI